MESFSKSLDTLLEAKDKILEEKDKQLNEMNKKLEEMNKKLEERDKQLVEIYNIDPVSYIVSSPPSGFAHDQCVGQYYPTGKSVNGFPIFCKGNLYLGVATNGNWIIGTKVSLDYREAIIAQSDKYPTPSAPPRNGWWSPSTLTSMFVSVKQLTVLPSSFITYRVSISNEDVPLEQLNRLLGYYQPTGEFENGFPVFKKGAYVLHVSNKGNWLINDSGDEVEGVVEGAEKVGNWVQNDEGIYVKVEKVDEGTKTVDVLILAYHPDKKPTPATPPPVGWKLTGIEHSSGSSPSVTVIPVIGTYQ